ncbi:MAG: hypothetical protein O7I93_15155 [Gemmatimonadetes bacterium]|nr:hypothetical protein [Gemmatimonadota bacterium]
MSPDAIEAICAFAGITSLGIIVLVGMKMRWNHKMQMLKNKGGECVDRLAELVDGFHDEVRALREENAELNERVDFAERLLSQGPAPQPVDDRISTPI